MKCLIVFIAFSIVMNTNSMACAKLPAHGENTYSSRIETFSFLSSGSAMQGKIFLPASYETNKNLPAIFLIDFTEQHFKIATDEFEKVIGGVRQLQGKEALVVTLKEIPDINAEPQNFKEHYEIFRNMALYVEGKYTHNTSRTFIGKGSESGVVMMALFTEDSESSVFDNFIATDPSGLYASAIINLLENKDFPENAENKNFIFHSPPVMIATDAPKLSA